MAEWFSKRLDLLDDYATLGGPGTAENVKVRVTVSRPSRNRYKIYGRTGYIGDWRYSSDLLKTPREFIRAYLDCGSDCDEFWDADLDYDLPRLIQFAPEFFTEVKRLWDSDDWEEDEEEAGKEGSGSGATTEDA